MSRTFTRRFAAIAAGPLVAAGIFAGSVVVADPADANAQTMSDATIDTCPGPLTGAAPVVAVYPAPPASVVTVCC